MARLTKETWLEFWDRFLKFTGLRPYSTGRHLADPYNIYAYTDTEDDKRALRVALFITISFHILLFLIRFATGDHVFKFEDRSLITLRNISGPPAAGGGQPKSATKRMEIPKPKPQPIPFPDPTPDEPEPLYQAVQDPAPEIVAQIGTELQIGDVNAPPGPGGRGIRGAGPGIGSGPGGPGTGSVYGIGDGVQPPVELVKTLPPYTEEARKARVEGVLTIQAIIRKDGTVDSFKVVRGLGYGLDASAINTIATKWRFKPGTLNGVPVDVQCNIEVAFRLY